MVTTTGGRCIRTSLHAARFVSLIPLEESCSSLPSCSSSSSLQGLGGSDKVGIDRARNMFAFLSIPLHCALNSHGAVCLRCWPLAMEAELIMPFFSVAFCWALA